MSITVACSACSSKLKVPDSAPGRKTKCPKCGAVVLVPLAGEHVAAPQANVAHPPPAVEQHLPPVKAVPDVHPNWRAKYYKDCPFCGEEVLATAKKCKHCGETLAVALGSPEEPSQPLDLPPRVDQGGPLVVNYQEEPRQPPPGPMSQEPYEAGAYDSQEAGPSCSSDFLSQEPYKEEANDSQEPAPSYSSDYFSPEAYASQRRRTFGRFCFIFLLFASPVGFGIYLLSVDQRVQQDKKDLHEHYDETIKKFLGHLVDGDYEKAYKTTSSAYQKKLSPDKQMSWKKFVDYVTKGKEVLQKSYKKETFELQTNLLGAAFGQKVTGKYCGWLKTETDKLPDVTVTILREEDEIKVEDFTISP